MAYRALQRILRDLRRVEERGDADELMAFIRDHHPLLAAHRSHWHELSEPVRTFLVSEIARLVESDSDGSDGSQSSGGGSGGKIVSGVVANVSQQKGGGGKAGGGGRDAGAPR